jgi:hypothetical protein
LQSFQASIGTARARLPAWVDSKEADAFSLNFVARSLG